jgi:hypothetical protein
MYDWICVEVTILDSAIYVVFILVIRVIPGKVMSLCASVLEYQEYRS